MRGSALARAYEYGPNDPAFHWLWKMAERLRRARPQDLKRPTPGPQKGSKRSPSGTLGSNPRRRRKK